MEGQAPVGREGGQRDAVRSGEGSRGAAGGGPVMAHAVSLAAGDDATPATNAWGAARASVGVVDGVRARRGA